MRMLRLGLAAGVVAAVLSGCGAHDRACDFARPGPGGLLVTAQALAPPPSGYRVKPGSVSTLAAALEAAA